MIKLNQDEWNELEQFLGHDPNIDGEWSILPSDSCKYVINSLGTHVIRLCSRDKRGSLLQTRELAFQSDEKGYRLCNINSDSKRVHRLVAQCWLSDYSEELTVNHKDGCHFNNRIDNLEMMTAPENVNHYHTSEAHAKQRNSDYAYHGSTIRGRIHITNGVDSKMIHSTELIPEGWWRGRPQSMKDNVAASAKGRVPHNAGKRCITNGKITRYISVEEDIPEGWEPGQSYRISHEQRIAQGADLSKRIYITKGTENKRVYPDDLDEYISQGWRKGMYSKRSSKRN